MSEWSVSPSAQRTRMGRVLARMTSSSTVSSANWMSPDAEIPVRFRRDAAAAAMVRPRSPRCDVRATAQHARDRNPAQRQARANAAVTTAPLGPVRKGAPARRRGRAVPASSSAAALDPRKMTTIDVNRSEKSCITAARSSAREACPAHAMSASVVGQIRLLSARTPMSMQ